MCPLCGRDYKDSSSLRVHHFKKHRTTSSLSPAEAAAEAVKQQRMHQLQLREVLMRAVSSQRLLQAAHDLDQSPLDVPSPSPPSASTAPSLPSVPSGAPSESSRPRDEPLLAPVAAPTRFKRDYDFLARDSFAAATTTPASHVPPTLPTSSLAVAAAAAASHNAAAVAAAAAAAATAAAAARSATSAAAASLARPPDALKKRRIGGEEQLFKLDKDSLVDHLSLLAHIADNVLSATVANKN